MSVPRHIEKELELLRKENALLRQKLEDLIKKVWGSSSEKVDIGQLLLFEDTEAKKSEGDEQLQEEESSPKPPKKRKKRTSREATLPKDILVQEIVIIPDEVKASPGDYRKVDEEKTTKLDYLPAQFKKIVIRRFKFVKRGDLEDEAFFIAPLPPSLKERSLLTPSLAAEIATNRYCDHLPYYRQEQHFLMRHGVHLARNTMSQWMQHLASDYLSGIYTAMQQDLLKETYLQVDETPIKYLEPGNGKTKQGYFWALSRPDIKSQSARGDIFYQWHLGRSANCLQSLLQTPEQRFLGILQCDGYSAYQSYKNQRNRQILEIELIACWAHVRRKFFDAKSYKPKITAWILKQIGNLYQIESKLRKARVGAAERERVRISESIPIYKRLGKALWMLKTKRKVLPESKLGEAIDYALGQWSKLELCFRDGRLEIDNNLIENGIRPTKLGAKNWLFMGSADAGQINAMWYSLIESCRRRKLNPRDYLVWIFEELPKIKIVKDTFGLYTPKAYAEKRRLNSSFLKVS